jgi:dephospho-CoA kinase
MLVIGLTGGMGAGKSTVARLFAERGAHVVDADAIAREVVEPGEPALAAIAEEFGDEVLTADGALDRAAMAGIVFDDPERLRALEAITHPAIRRRIEARLAAHADVGDDRIVVLDHPLLVETGLAEDLAVVVVVTAPEDVRVARLAAGRGIDPADARARMRNQADDEQRRAAATHVIVNDCGLDALERDVAAVWLSVTAGTDG